MPELIENKVSHVTQTEGKDVCAEVSHVTLSPLETLDAIERGICPASLDEINRAIGFQISMTEKATSNIAFCIALVRRDYLTDKRQWKEWAVRTCKFTNLSHMHKLKKIGFVMISGELSRNYTKSRPQKGAGPQYFRKDCQSKGLPSANRTFPCCP